MRAMPCPAPAQRRRMWAVAVAVVVSLAAAESVRHRLSNSLCDKFLHMLLPHCGSLIGFIIGPLYPR